MGSEDTDVCIGHDRAVVVIGANACDRMHIRNAMERCSCLFNSMLNVLCIGMMDGGMGGG